MSAAPPPFAAPGRVELESALARPHGPVQVLEGAAGGPFRPAAVLIPVIERPAGLSVLLIRRSEALAVHAGQIGFPGGRIEKGDPHSLGAALREAQEEVGLDPALVTPVGTLPQYRTGTGFEIVPHVGFVPEDFVPVPDGGEVAEVFEAPLGFLLDPSNRQWHSALSQGRRRWYYAIPYEHHFIWGATAGILKTLADRIAESAGHAGTGNNADAVYGA